MPRYGSKKKGWPKKPGSLVYYGGTVHEVLHDGYATLPREELQPGSSLKLWKPKYSLRGTPASYAFRRRGSKLTSAEKQQIKRYADGKSSPKAAKATHSWKKANLKHYRHHGKKRVRRYKPKYLTASEKRQIVRERAARTAKWRKIATMKRRGLKRVSRKLKNGMTRVRYVKISKRRKR